MKISFLVTIHNEGVNDLGFLLDQLSEYKKINPQDEIVVLDDYSDNLETLELLEKYKDDIKHVKHSLDLNFGRHKQAGNEQCSGEYVFQTDADEYFAEDLLYGLKDLVEENPDVELFLVPRINIIRGLTKEHLKRYPWDISKISGLGDGSAVMDQDSEEFKFLNDNGFVRGTGSLPNNKIRVSYDYPLINQKSGDYQFRFYANRPHIKWERPLHELIVGAKTITQIPNDPNWCLIHDKSIEKQLEQNAFYNKNFSKEMNVRKG